MEEIWVPIKGYEGLYEVSNHGRVKSLPRLSQPKKRPNCKPHRAKVNNGILHSKPKRDYPKVHLHKDGTCKQVLIHKLVLETFSCPRPTPKTVAMHLDGTKTNNNISNLRWGSYSCNEAFKFDDGTAQIGSRNHNAKLKESDVLKIRKLLSKGKLTELEIAESFGVTRANINYIRRNKAWAWL